MIKFPKDFLWGSSTSGPQSEGVIEGDGKGESIWDYWYHKEPYKFHDEVGPEIASTFLKNYKDDIKLLKKQAITLFELPFNGLD